jgi:hypothetical protein
MMHKTDHINSFFNFTAEYEADHSLSSSAEVKNGGAVPHKSSYHAVQRFKHKNFTFTFTSKIVVHCCSCQVTQYC